MYSSFCPRCGQRFCERAPALADRLMSQHVDSQACEQKAASSGFERTPIEIRILNEEDSASQLADINWGAISGELLSYGR